jgi:hypothetical protein
MEPLNYCRQMVRQFSSTLAERAIEPWMRDEMAHAIDLSQWSTKFMLPDGGILLDDPEFRGLEGVDRIRLPYQYIALEYNRPEQSAPIEGERHCSKALVFIRETEEFLIVTPIVWSDPAGKWAPMEAVGIRLDDYIDRTVKQPSGGPSFKVILPRERHIQWPLSDYQDELSVLMHFLNAISCSNVKSERLNTPKKKVKSALPFDEYRVLTIDCPKASAGNGHSRDGINRSPREHLRRGHIRRLEDGRRLWINATVVNAGKGGKTSKDYTVRDPRIAGLT